MAIINYSTRDLELKIVYFGPAYAGKTTNLRWIHARLSPPESEGVASLQTGLDRTLFFEFTPARAELLEGFQTRFQLYAVPGAVALNAPRQLVLRDVDGIVFVADSQWDRIEDTVASVCNLEENVERHGRTVDEIPMVIQFNKRDLPHPAPIDYLEFLLNNRKVRRPTFEAVARRGENVFECLDAITDLVRADFLSQRDVPRRSAG